MKANDGNWNPPAEGSSGRKEMPRDAFADPHGRRYPFKEQDASGQWVPSKEGVNAALHVASLRHDGAVIHKMMMIKREKGW